MKRDKRKVSNINSFCFPGQRVRDGSGTNTPEHGSSIPVGKFPDFFRCIPITFLCFPPGTGRKSPEKVRKFSGWNTTSMFRRLPVYFGRIQRFFHLFPEGSFGIWSPESSIWVHNENLIVVFFCQMLIH